jgi:hypothetical protein
MVELANFSNVNKVTPMSLDDFIQQHYDLSRLIFQKSGSEHVQYRPQKSLDMPVVCRGLLSKKVDGFHKKSIIQIYHIYL